MRMYSKNDYRYYLENQLIHSDDFLAHYGVKGMKWKVHKNRIVRNEDWGDGAKRTYYQLNGKVGSYGDKVGIIKTNNRDERSISAFNTKNRKYFRDGEKYTKKKLGRLSVEYAEDGAQYKLDLSSNKQRKRMRKKKTRQAVNEGSFWVQNAAREAASATNKRRK